MANWKRCRMVEGWKIRRDADGYTLTAQIYAPSRDDLPNRYDAVTVDATSTCAVPAQFVAYRVVSSETYPLTSAGPYIADVTVKSRVNSGSNMNTGDTLLTQNSMSAAYMDFHIPADWCCVRRRTGDQPPSSSPSEAFTLGWQSSVQGDVSEDGKSCSWKNYLKTLPTAPFDCPFTRRPYPAYADQTLRFLCVTTEHYARRSKAGLDKWGKFSGIIPVGSMPKWITIPGGDNRWRLWDEQIEATADTDGRTDLWHIRRTLLGIPSNVKAAKKSGDSVEEGDRLQWSQAKIGQRDWDDLT